MSDTRDSKTENLINIKLPDTYNYTFESIEKKQTILQEYFVSQYNNENYRFIAAVVKLNQMSTESNEWQKQVEFIQKNFLLEGSKEEVNLSTEFMNPIKQAFQENNKIKLSDSLIAAAKSTKTLLELSLSTTISTFNQFLNEKHPKEVTIKLGDRASLQNLVDMLANSKTFIKNFQNNSSQSNNKSLAIVALRKKFIEVSNALKDGRSLDSGEIKQMTIDLQHKVENAITASEESQSKRTRNRISDKLDKIGIKITKTQSAVAQELQAILNNYESPQSNIKQQVTHTAEKNLPEKAPTAPKSRM